MALILREIEDERYWDNKAHFECKVIYPNHDLYCNRLATVKATYCIYSLQLIFASLLKKPEPLILTEVVLKGVKMLWKNFSKFSKKTCSKTCFFKVGSRHW